jgi:hypothetical protein
VVEQLLCIQRVPDSNFERDTVSTPTFNTISFAPSCQVAG